MTGLPAGWKVEAYLGGAWTDITAWHVGEDSTSLHFGRTSEYGDIAAGTCSFALRNEDGRFTPGYSGSPYYPDVAPGTKVRLSVTHGVTTERVFTGKIVALEPSWPGRSLAGGVVRVSCSDALTDLATVTEALSADRWTQRARALANAAGSWCDVPLLDSNGATSGLQNVGITLTTLGACTGLAGASYGAATGLSLAHAMGNTVAVSVTPQAAPQSVGFWVRIPSDALPTSAAYVDWVCSPGPFKVTIIRNMVSGDIDLQIRDAGYTVVATPITGVGDDTWRYITFVPNATPTSTDITIRASDGTVQATYTIAADIRTATGISWGTGNASFKWTVAGIVVSGTGPVSWDYASPGRLATLSETFADLQISRPDVTWPWALTGGEDPTIGEPTWVGQSTAAVLQQLARTVLGVAWCRPDGTIELRTADVTWPVTPAATLDVESDLDAASMAPTLRYGADETPTRVTVTWATGTTTVINAALEATRPRNERSITTASANATQAGYAANVALVQSDGLRVSQIAIDLYSATQDLWGALLGLYPTCMLRLSGWPVQMTGLTAVDVAVQGWSVDISESAWRVTLDCSPGGMFPAAAWDVSLWDDPAAVWRY